MNILLKILKALVIFIVGWISFWRFRYLNRLSFSGTVVLKNLPKKNVLFVSNHQTYFADIVGMLHIMSAVKWGCKKLPLIPYYLFWPELNVTFIAAEETMKGSGIIPKIFTLAGAISVKRTWRTKGADIQRNVDPKDTEKIAEALAKGWVITFPQGTTRAYSPGRKGTAVLIHQHNPIVIPVVINGFRRAFDRKGFLLKKRNTKLTIAYKFPMEIKTSNTIDDTLEQVMEAIEQSSSSYKS